VEKAACSIALSSSTEYGTHRFVKLDCISGPYKKTTGHAKGQLRPCVACGTGHDGT